MAKPVRHRKPARRRVQENSHCAIRLKPVVASIKYACLPAGLAMLLNPGPLLAGPEGGEVTSGTGTISTPLATGSWSLASGQLIAGQHPAARSERPKN